MQQAKLDCTAGLRCITRTTLCLFQCRPFVRSNHFFPGGGGALPTIHTHTHTHTHYVKEIKKPEPNVDSRQTGHLSKQLVRPQQKTVSLRLGAFLRDSKNGNGSVLPPLQSHISPPVVLLPLHTHTHTLTMANRHYKGTECKDSRQADPTVKEKA